MKLNFNNMKNMKVPKIVINGGFKILLKSLIKKKISGGNKSCNI